MKFDILTLFPEMFEAVKQSVIGKAIEKQLIQINLINIRNFSKDKHKKVDDTPYGGGAGMVMMPSVVYDAYNSIQNKENAKVIYLSPKGNVLNQEKVLELSKQEHLILLCGHYEGIDERAFKEVDLEISLGDFILTGGEMAAIPVIDSVLRLVPGVLNKSESHEDESFSDGLLEYPQYTRPEIFEGESVPSVLISGHHENIRKWRRLKSLEITKKRRPDLYKSVVLTKEDKKLLNNKK